MADRIYIFDTTLRDGEQTPGVNLNAQEKLEIALQLEKLGVDAIEAGFPIASNGDFCGVQSIARNVKNATIVALARAMKQDIDRAWEAIKDAEKPRIHTFIATSDLHIEYKLKMTRQQVLDRAVEAVRYAKSMCPEVEFSPEDATRSDPEYLCKIVEAVIDAGADVVNIPDTVGYTTPEEFGELLDTLKNNVKNIDKAIISVHCHNDLGMAVANSLSAVKHGARQIECAVNGLGERAGNASLEELVMALKVRKDRYNAYTDASTEQICKTSTLVSRLSGIHIQPNKAIVGANAFSHESGIHQHGMMANRNTYEIMTPESVGLKQSKLVLGKHSGRHAFEERINELGYTLNEQQLNDAFVKFKDLADKKKTVLDEDIDALISQKISNETDGYKLKYFHVLSGNSLISTATVKIEKQDNTIEEASCGDGPVDAIFNAIEKAIGFEINLKDFNLRAVTSGKDALGEATVRIEKNGKIYVGKGLSTDVVESSAQAYMRAINRMNQDNNL